MWDAVKRQLVRNSVLETGEIVDGTLIESGAFAPSSWSIGFIKAPLAVAVDAIESWYGKISSAPPNHTRVEGTLGDRLRTLEPLTIGGRRELLIQTQNPSWVAWFDCDLLGDPKFGKVGVISSGIPTEGVAITRAVRNDAIGGSSPTHDALQFAMYGDGGSLLHRGLRTISLTAEDRRWHFEMFGEPRDFERQELYNSRRKVDRFTVEMLTSYCRSLGLDPFVDSFYEGASVLVEAPSIEVPGAPHLRFAEYLDYLQAPLS